MATSGEVQGRIKAFVRQLAEEFGEVDETNALSWLDAVETRAVAIGDAVATELLKQKSAERPAQPDESYCPQCGQEGQYKGLRQRELTSRRGPVMIHEPAYFCPCCRKSFFPDDRSDRRGDRLSLHAGDAP
jgi:hypothetical protein